MNCGHHEESDQSLDDVLADIEMANRLKLIKHTLLVLSGKGGVGKSTTAANLALALALSGRKVGLLDIDFHGPSIPKLLGLEGKKLEVENGSLVPIGFGDNLKVVSLGFLLQNEDEAVIWRGPMKMGAIKQLLRDVAWGELDYLVVDSPPGTGDEPLSIIQLLEHPTGAIVVTQPQDLSVADVRRSIRFCESLHVPVLGVIENMSGFICPHCNESIDIFKNGGGEKMAAEMKVPFLGKVPLDPDIVTSSDAGQPFVYFNSKSQTSKTFENIVHCLIDEVETMSEEKQTPAAVQTSMRRYAVPTAAGELCSHFGHCDQFAMIDFDLDKMQVASVQWLTPPAHEPGVLPRWLHEQKVQFILAGGMGARAQDLLAQNGIQVITGAPKGKPEELVQAHVQGTLTTGANVCDH